MPPKKNTLGTAQGWLKRAKGNLALAKQPKPKEAFWDDLCFDAQQAAEKSIKAVLVHRQIDFPKTHNIRALLELLDPMGSEISKEIWQAIDLTNYAVETRYPGPAEPVNQKRVRTSTNPSREGRQMGRKHNLAQAAEISMPVSFGGRNGDRLIFTWTEGLKKVEIGAALKCNGHVRSRS